MAHKIVRSSNALLIAFALFGLGVQSVLAANAPLVSGSYHVIRSASIGPHEQVRMTIHLVNRGRTSFAVRRMTIWDFSHPSKGGSQPCAIVLRPHGSSVTTQEFTIQQSEYELWKRGLRPRLVLELVGTSSSANRSNSKAVLRLDREPGQEGK
jgi:hypothetical protein